MKYFCCLRNNDGDGKMEFQRFSDSCEVVPSTETKRRVEAQFAINGITSEETKFNYLVAQLESRYIENIWDIIKDTGSQKYSAAKDRLMQTFRESETQQIKRLLTGLELGDMKPSQLLRKMRSLGDSEIYRRRCFKLCG
ncbi:hypothetical protein AVEN_205025-1 [Araneus ventricosus]|uniref:DUF7041 domain-containing protein n=1 Tax=Araneus ventricosus TaxID=182803 RepID=A0A4Y2L843_ARAVE|nr:hypothetical protein AVEN_205025-1 [Araneus ventricosus]